MWKNCPLKITEHCWGILPEEMEGCIALGLGDSILLKCLISLIERFNTIESLSVPVEIVTIKILIIKFIWKFKVSRESKKLWRNFCKDGSCVKTDN